MTTGVRLVWNYVFQGWTTDLVSGSAPITSAAMVGQNPGTVPVYTCLESDSGDISQESTTSYLDNGAWVAVELQTPWLHMAGLNGFQRARRTMLQFESNSGADISVSYAFDYVASYTETTTALASAVATWSFGQFSKEVGRQKCQAIKVKLIDASPTGVAVGTGQGPTMVGLTLELGVKPKLARIPIAQES